MGKRKSEQVDESTKDEPRRSSRRIARAAGSASTRPAATPTRAQPKKSGVNGVAKDLPDKPEPKPGKSRKAASEPESRSASAKKAGPKPAASSNGTSKTDTKVAVTADAPTSVAPGSGEKQYWLMKAEPESRPENGVDVKFSIDDLAAKTEPEPWDGIRSYPARNNLRAMRKGDLAFFYHSNCKEPGIVGIMEIVQEHSPDLSAHDPKAPYYDPQSKPEDPRWSVVHVAFRRKFAVPIGLRELRELQKQASSPLENMQMLRMSRLSVSRVSENEWEFLVALAEEKERAAEAAEANE